jgi:nucleotide-binding universal stress UspA family protein
MEEPIRQIVVGVGEIEDDPHLAPAIRLAEAAGATLHAVYAFHLPDPLLYSYPSVNVFDPSVIRGIEDDARSRLEAEVRKVSDSDRIHCRVVSGSAELAVLKVAQEVDADLVIVGATRRGTLARTILGTTAQRVVRASQVPVLVRRRADRGSMRRVLLTTDLSDLSEAVCRRALDLLTSLGAAGELQPRTLLVLNYLYGLVPPPPLSQRRVEEAAEADLTAFLERVASGAPASSGKVRMGEPATEIVTEASDWDADLVVLGTHGRTGVSRFLIGSVAEAVLRGALCDVLVIPATAAVSPDARPADQEGGSHERAT